MSFETGSVNRSCSRPGSRFVDEARVLTTDDGRGVVRHTLPADIAFVGIGVAVAVAVAVVVVVVVVVVAAGAEVVVAAIVAAGTDDSAGDAAYLSAQKKRR